MGDLGKTLFNFAAGYAAGYAIQTGINAIKDNMNQQAQNPYGQLPPNQSPYGQIPPNPNPYGQNPYAQPLPNYGQPQPDPRINTMNFNGNVAKYLKDDNYGCYDSIEDSMFLE